MSCLYSGIEKDLCFIYLPINILVYLYIMLLIEVVDANLVKNYLNKLVTQNVFVKYYYYYHYNNT